MIDDKNKTKENLLRGLVKDKNENKKSNKEFNI